MPVREPKPPDLQPEAAPRQAELLTARVAQQGCDRGRGGSGCRGAERASLRREMVSVLYEDAGLLVWLLLKWYVPAM